VSPISGPRPGGGGPHQRKWSRVAALCRMSCSRAPGAAAGPAATNGLVARAGGPDAWSAPRWPVPRFQNVVTRLRGGQVPHRAPTPGKQAGPTGRFRSNASTTSISPRPSGHRRQGLPQRGGPAGGRVAREPRSASRVHGCRAAIGAGFRGRRLPAAEKGPSAQQRGSRGPRGRRWHAARPGAHRGGGGGGGGPFARSGHRLQAQWTQRTGAPAAQAPPGTQRHGGGVAPVRERLTDGESQAVADRPPARGQRGSPAPKSDRPPEPRRPTPTSSTVSWARPSPGTADQPPRQTRLRHVPAAGAGPVGFSPRGPGRVSNEFERWPSQRPAVLEGHAGRP